MCKNREGGNDYGLFAIAFVTLLCVGRDPLKEHFGRQIMCQELLKSFKEDMAFFVEKTCSTSKKDPEILYELCCPIHCHCRVPDDGNEMVLSVACKHWFHSKCKIADFYSPHWPCKQCQNVSARKQKKESKRKNEDKV